MDDEGPRPRAALSRAQGYVAGPPAVAPPGGRLYRVALNENSAPPPSAVRAAIAEAAGGTNRYPDVHPARLTAALAARLGRPADELVAGAGSNRLLTQILAGFAGDGDEVVYAWRSFEAYPENVAISGADDVPVPLTADHRHDLPAMVAAVGPRTRVVLLCSPNNPTGTALRATEVEEFLAAVPRRVLVVLDEAYADYVRDPAAADGLRLLDRHPHLLVLRTFSKAYGLAGLRVGYAVGRPAVVDAVRRAGVPFAVPQVAEAAALAALGAQAEVQAGVAAVVAGRERLTAALRDLGLPVADSQANFVWLPLGDRAADLGRACREAGVLVRVFPGEGVRITIGEPEAMDHVLSICTGPW